MGMVHSGVGVGGSCERRRAHHARRAPHIRLRAAPGPGARPFRAPSRAPRGLNGHVVGERHRRRLPDRRHHAVQEPTSKHEAHVKTTQENLSAGEDVIKLMRATFNRGERHHCAVAV